MPRPILQDNSGTTMRLLVNFPPVDTESSHNDLNIQDTPGPSSPPVPERKNSKLLSEGLLKAMRAPSSTIATYEVSEEYDDSYPDITNPWVVDNERRDSIESTRKKLAAKGVSGVTKGKNQRLRRGLRESRRSTGVALFNEVSKSKNKRRWPKELSKGTAQRNCPKELQF